MQSHLSRGHGCGDTRTAGAHGGMAPGTTLPIQATPRASSAEPAAPGPPRPSAFPPLPSPAAHLLPFLPCRALLTASSLTSWSSRWTLGGCPRTSSWQDAGVWHLVGIEASLQALKQLGDQVLQGHWRDRCGHHVGTGGGRSLGSRVLSAVFLPALCGRLTLSSALRGCAAQQGQQDPNAQSHGKHPLRTG